MDIQKIDGEKKESCYFIISLSQKLNSSLEIELYTRVEISKLLVGGDFTI